MLSIKGVTWKQVFKVTLRSQFILSDEIKIEYISLAVSLSNVRSLAFFMGWWFRTRRLLFFFVKFCFSISGVLRVLTDPIDGSHLSTFAIFWIDRIRFTNWSTKLIFFCENLVKLTVKLSIIITLLNLRFCERMPEIVSGSVDRYCFQFSKIFL